MRVALTMDVWRTMFSLGSFSYGSRDSTATLVLDASRYLSTG